MTNMNKYIAIASAALALCCANSCQDFLTEEPILEQSNELTLSTLSGVNKAVAGAYSPLASTTWYGANFIIYNEMKTGNGKKYFNSDWDSGRLTDAYNVNFSESSTYGLWGYGYYVISAANNAIDALENVEGDAQTKKNLKAEALFLRALAHFDLVRTYAQPYNYTADASHDGVPVVLHTDANAKPARESVAKVYAQIVADLLEAESIIDPTYVRSGVADAKSAVSIYAIQAFLSRAYLRRLPTMLPRSSTAANTLCGSLKTLKTPPASVKIHLRVERSSSKYMVSRPILMMDIMTASCL